MRYMLCAKRIIHARLEKSFTTMYRTQQQNEAREGRGTKQGVGKQILVYSSGERSMKERNTAGNLLIRAAYSSRNQDEASLTKTPRGREYATARGFISGILVGRRFSRAVVGTLQPHCL